MSPDCPYFLLGRGTSSRGMIQHPPSPPDRPWYDVLACSKWFGRLKYPLPLPSAVNTTASSYIIFTALIVAVPALVFKVAVISTDKSGTPFGVIKYLMGFYCDSSWLHCILRREREKCLCRSLYLATKRFFHYGCN